MITYIVLAIIVGWLSGLIVNYLADVLPLRRKLVQPFCIQCDTHQNWGNYLIWPRKCPVCGQRRTIRVWIVDVFYIISSILLLLYPPYRIGFILGMIVLAYLGVVVLIDLEYRLIMHPVSIIGAVLGIIIGVVRVGWLKALLGGIAGFSIMWLIYLLGVVMIKLVSRRRGQPINDVALGFGDVNLSGVLGLMLGWPLILVGLVTSILIGGLVSLFYLAVKLLTSKYQAFMVLPYGPFLVFGAALFLYFRDVILVFIGK